MMERITIFGRFEKAGGGRHDTYGFVQTILVYVQDFRFIDEYFSKLIINFKDTL